jgi:hypothetical protein
MAEPKNPAYTYRRLLDMSRTAEQRIQYIVIFLGKSVIAADNFSSLLPLSPSCHFLICFVTRLLLLLLFPVASTFGS